MVWHILSIFELMFLFAGVYFPLATIDEFWVFTNEFSLLSLLFTLLLNDEILLGLIVGIFGLIFPIIKIIIRVFPIHFFYLIKIHKFGMVDIFLLSFLVYAGKTSAFFEIHLMIGFYFLLFALMLGYLQLIFNKKLPD